MEKDRKIASLTSFFSKLLFYLIFYNICFTFCHTVLKTILISIIPYLFVSAAIQKKFSNMPSKKQNLKKLEFLEKKEEKLTKEIEELQDILSKLNLQEIKIERANTPIKPMKHDNTEIKPLTKKLTNNKTRNQ